MHSGRCPRDVEDELPEALSTINIKTTSKENNTRSLGARRVFVVCLLFVVGCLFVIVRVQWLLNYAVMQFSFVVVVVLVIVLSTRITSNTNKKKQI